MGLKALVLGVTAVGITQVFAASHEDLTKWVGVWRGELDGQPGVILNLSERDGTLSGTAVFNVVIKKEGKAHVAGSAVDAVRDPRVDGATLTFHVTRKSDDRDLVMVVHRAGEDKARLQCQTCGADSPVADLVKSR